MFVAVGAGLAAALLAALVIRPFEAATVDPDAAAAVLFFDRILHGQRLEVFVSTTPKPLLTLLYGATWTLTGDWRLPTFEALAALAIAVGAAVRLGQRLAGPAAGAVAGTALALSVDLVGETARANSVVWAVAGWLVAGVALTEPRRRPWVAGIALFVAASCRTETLLVLGLATIALAAMAVRGDAARATARTCLPILGAWLALPVAALHDLLLVGDPFAWLAVPSGYTAIVTPDLGTVSPGAFLRMVAERYADRPLLTGLGVAGMLLLARQRRWVVLGGVGALTAGIVALLAFVAWRAIYITPRYFEQVDVALIIPAAVTVGTAVATIRSRATDWRPPPGLVRLPRSARPVGPALAGSAVAILLVWPTAPFDPGLAASLDSTRMASRNTATVEPELRSILAAAGGPAPDPIRGPGGLPVTDPARVTVFVPRSQLSRLAVDLGVPLTKLGDSFLAFRDRGPLGSILPGQAVYHDRAADRIPELFGPLEASGPLDGPGIRLVPIAVDPLAGTWILAANAH